MIFYADSSNLEILSKNYFHFLQIRNESNDKYFIKWKPIDCFERFLLKLLDNIRGAPLEPQSIKSVI